MERGAVKCYHLLDIEHCINCFFLFQKFITKPVRHLLLNDSTFRWRQIIVYTVETENWLNVNKSSMMTYASLTLK